MGDIFGNVQYNGSVYYKYGGISDRNFNTETPLKRIIKVLNYYSIPVSLTEISVLAGIEKSALEGMIGFLLRKGKIVEITLETEEDFSRCTMCSAKSCPVLKKVSKEKERYFKAGL